MSVEFIHLRLQGVCNIPLADTGATTGRDVEALFVQPQSTDVEQMIREFAQMQLHEL